MAGFHKHTAILGAIPPAVKMFREKKTVVAGRKKVGVCQYLQRVRVFKCVDECLTTHSVHFFGAVLGVVICGDIGESDILLSRHLLVTYFSLHVEANH